MSAVPTPDEPDAATLDALASAFFGKAVCIDLIGTGWIRRDVAVAVAVRIAERSRGQGAIFATARAGVVRALRRLQATDDEIAVAVTGMREPPSLTLLAWVSGMVRM